MLKYNFKCQHFKLAYSAEVTISNSLKDLINGGIWRQRAVKDVKLSLQSLWDVISSSSRMNHGAHHLYVHNCRELSWLLQIVESFHFHHLTSNFVSYLETNSNTHGIIISAISWKIIFVKTYCNACNVFDVFNLNCYYFWFVQYIHITWSPHSLMTGMLISSTKTVILFPAGGPYVVPIRLST